MSENVQPHILCKKGDLHRNALLPGDPGRVPLIAKNLSKAKKVKYNREFLSYNGYYGSLPVSIVSTGIGCPSTLIAMEELANIGVENFIRIGTCGGLKSNVMPGDLIIPIAAMKPDGAMLGYNVRDKPVGADRNVVEALVQAAKNLNVRYHTGVNRTHDSFYESTKAFLQLKGKNLVSSEMECAAVYLAARMKGLKAGCVLVVNTYEPPEEVERDPNIIYKLSDQKAVKVGMDNAIKVALEAMKILNNK